MRGAAASASTLLWLQCLLPSSHAQKLYDAHQSLAQKMHPTYANELCAFYDVHRLSWSAVQHVVAGRGTRRWSGAELRNERDYPRLGELLVRHGPNVTVCDGYGHRRGEVLTQCSECPGDPFRESSWPVLLCGPRPLAPVAPPVGMSAAGALNLLLVSSDHNNHGLFAQVERVLNQLHLAESLGIPPVVYLGRKVAAAPWSCDVGENQYFDAAHGPNVWEYYFERVSAYALGDPTHLGRPVRLLLAPAEDARRHAIRTARDAVTSYFEFKRYNADLHEIRTRVRRFGARLVRRWVRVKPAVRKDAAERLQAWRQRASHLLGVHLRGTDKVTHPRVPLERFTGAIDRYLAAHPGALIVLCTDDAAYHTAMVKRYGGRVVSATTGYQTANIVRDPSIDRHEKGRSALVDALLLAHTDFLLKGTSSLSEFAIWYNPALIERHIDLQIEGDGAESTTYKALLPGGWAGRSSRRRCSRAATRRTAAGPCARHGRWCDARAAGCGPKLESFACARVVVGGGGVAVAT